MILTADWHLDDNPANEYRWQVFYELFEFCSETEDGEVFLLGDIADRKDRHSGELLNRMLKEFKKFSDAGISIMAIMGNHDAPLKGTPYWSVLNMLPGVKFFTQPRLVRANGVDIWMLPYTPYPHADWKDLDMHSNQVAFIHQPTQGALLESGRRLVDVPALPKLPMSDIWAGDIHTHQKIGKVNYVGAPHPMDYGDDYPCRMIQLSDGDDALRISETRELDYMRKAMLDLKCLGELDQDFGLQDGDQAKVRMQVDPKRISQWPADRQEIQEWGRRMGITIASIEAKVTFTVAKKADVPDIRADMEQVFKDYCELEGLGDETIEIGLDILQETE
jgi:hypothetical protein